MTSTEMKDWPRKPLYNSEAIEGVPANSSKRETDHSLLPWLPEIGGLLGGLISVAIVIGLLAAYNGHQVPEWHGVTFNFVIGVLAQIAHALMIGPLGAAMGQLKWWWFWDESRPRRLADSQAYDKAGRGVVGAVSILFGTRLRPATAIGALLIIATLGIDPFLQGIPTYPIRLVPANGSAFISIAKGYSSIVPSAAGADSSEQSWELGSPTKGAFYSGLFNTTSSNVIVPLCPTGNCTWDPYSSLGVCSACSDVTSSLESEINPVGFDGESNIWTLPNGLSADSASYQMLANTSYSTIKYGNLQDYVLADVSSIYWKDAMIGNPTSASAYECALYLCVHTYAAHVSRGEFHETMLSSFPNTSTPTTEAQSAINPGPSAKSLPLLHPTGAVKSIEPGDTAIISPPNQAGTYEIDTPTFILMRQWLQVTFDSYLDATADPGSQSSDVSQVLYDSLKNDHFPMLAEGIANSLTAQMRNLATETANGTTLSVVTVVQPRWAWLIFPLVVLALAMLFLLTTMALSARNKMPTWKSSTLPGMVYSMDAATSSAIAARGPRLREMEAEAKRHLVALSRDDGQWKLAGTRHHADARFV